MKTVEQLAREAGLHIYPEYSAAFQRFHDLAIEAALSAKQGEQCSQVTSEYSEQEPTHWPEAPKEIYLVVCGDDDCDQPFREHGEVTWCEDMIHATDIRYVRADTHPAPSVNAQEAKQEALLDSTVPPHALYYPLSDYHRAPAEGPLNFTWIDKPHRLLYDLIAAVKFYANPAPDAKQETTCKQDLQVPTVKECLTVQCWVTNAGQFSFEPQDERYWTRMVPAPSVNAQEPVGKFAKFTDGVWREVTDGSPGVLLYTHPAPEAKHGCCEDCVPLSIDGKSVFIDGMGEIPLDFSTPSVNAQERISELEAMTTDKQQARIDGKVTEQDGCPTELAVLQRFWREAQRASIAQERISELEAQNAQLLGALKHIEELSVCGWSAGIARAAIAAVEGKI